MKNIINSAKKYVVVMEPVSNSKYYLPEILKRGYVPIAIFPKAGSACRFAREQVMHYVKDLAVFLQRRNWN